MNSSSSPRKINYSHALLITGLVLSMLVVMFRPSGADATLPNSVNVFKSWDDDTGSSLRLDSLGQFTNDYDVLLNNKTKPSTVKLSGYKLSAILDTVQADLKDVQFVKLRLNTTNDALVYLVELHPEASERPAMILASGKKPGLGPFPTPSIVPAQPDPDKPILESQIIPFLAKAKAPLSIIPAKPGAKVLHMSLSKKRSGKDQWKFTPVIKDGKKGEPRETHWYGYDKNNAVVDLGTGDSYTTTDAGDKSAPVQIGAVVTEETTQSTGSASREYSARTTSKGRTKKPYPDPTGSTGNTGNGGGSGSGSGNNNGFTQGGSTNVPYTAPAPSSATGQPQQSTTTPPPTAATTSPETSPAVDTTAITNAAQNVNGTPGLHTVTGVLLSTPTIAPASDSGSGTPLSALPQPVQDQINSIFQPVDSTDDVWAYLLAILFAFSISGAVREWVNP